MSGIARGVFLDTKRRANAALQNETLTRQRVDNLEQSVEKLADFTGKTELAVQDLMNWRALSSFRQRLRWLFTGR